MPELQQPWTDFITDAGNYTVWYSGITHIQGEPRNGGTIRIQTTTGGHRTFRLRGTAARSGDDLDGAAGVF